MDPLDFLAVARNLSESAQESGRRTSVGRSYYGVFNHLRLKLKPIKRLPGTEEDHQAVVQYLMAANNADLSSVGQSLKDLRTSRNVADYDMKAAVDHDQSRLALVRADKAIEKFHGVNDANLRAAIGALATFRGRRESKSR